MSRSKLAITSLKAPDMRRKVALFECRFALSEFVATTGMFIVSCVGRSLIPADVLDVIRLAYKQSHASLRHFG